MRPALVLIAISVVAVATQLPGIYALYIGLIGGCFGLVALYWPGPEQQPFRHPTAFELEIHPLTDEERETFKDI